MSKMSGQGTQRVRRMVSPSTKSTGPMKATLTFGLVQPSSPTRGTSQSANGRKTNNTSPSSSPTPQWTSERSKRRSPDNRSSPDRTSPSSPSIKVERPKPIRVSPSPMIKRTGSLDTITAPYLTGQWPKADLIFPIHPPSLAHQLSADKSTQTPDDWDMDTSSLDRKKKSSHKRSASVGTGDTKKEIKSRWSKKSSSPGLQRSSPVSPAHMAFLTPPPPPPAGATGAASSAVLIQSKAVAIPQSHYIPKPTTLRMRGSVEGPSQEIERALTLNISGFDGDDYLRVRDPTPDGHRAPVLELLGTNTRSIDTQTPSAYIDDKDRINEEPVAMTMGSSSSSRSSSSSSGSGTQNDSPSFPIIPGQMDSSRPSSQEEHGQQSDEIREEVERVHKLQDKTNYTDKDLLGDEIESIKCVPSPKPNKSFSFVRSPPDGCEKVKTVIEEPRRIPPVKEPLLCCPIKPSPVYRIPSSDSAFCPLPPPHKLTPPIPLVTTAPSDM